MTRLLAWAFLALSIFLTLVAIIFGIIYRYPMTAQIFVGLLLGAGALAVISLAIPAAKGPAKVGLTQLEPKRPTQVQSEPPTVIRRDSRETKEYEKKLSKLEELWSKGRVDEHVYQRLRNEYQQKLSETTPSEPYVTQKEASKFCRKCGAKIPRDSEYCEECGARLA